MAGCLPFGIEVAVGGTLVGGTLVAGLDEVAVACGAAAVAAVVASTVASLVGSTVAVGPPGVGVGARHIAKEAAPAVDAGVAA